MHCRIKNKNGWECPCGKPIRFILKRLQSALNLIAAQATRADGHALGHAIDKHFDLLRVGSPGAARLAVGVADVVTVNYALAANFTKLSHTLSHLLQGYVTSKHMNYTTEWHKTQVLGV